MKTWVVISIISVLLISILAFISWRLLVEQPGTSVRTAQATRQTIVKDITFTGTVESKQSADISFELSGTIQDLFVSVGDRVTKGQKLALLDPQSVELELAKAHADKVNTSSVERLSWEKADADASNIIAENAKIAEQKRQAVRDAKAELDQSKEVFAQKAVESGNDSAATLATYSTVVANAAAYNSAKAALETTLLTIEKSNSTATQAADIAYAQYTGTLPSLTALESLARVKANKSIVRAPFDGVVTKKNMELGEFATIGSSIFTVETADALQISANVPETDALALAENMNASVTFDAISSAETMHATVTHVYPAATPLEGVPTFHVVITPNTSTAHLRSGITANVTVHAAKKEQVLAVPRRAIITKDETQYVRVETNDQEFQDVAVTTGLTGSDGLVEILSGLKEGDRIVIP